MSSLATPSSTPCQTRIDVYDRANRARWAERLGVTDERLRKAVRIVGNRVSSVSAYLAR